VLKFKKKTADRCCIFANSLTIQARD